LWEWEGNNQQRGQLQLTRETEQPLECVGDGRGLWQDLFPVSKSCFSNQIKYPMV
jgi:hypothetical protein